MKTMQVFKMSMMVMAIFFTLSCSEDNIDETDFAVENLVVQNGATTIDEIKDTNDTYRGSAPIPVEEGPRIIALRVNWYTNISESKRDQIRALYFNSYKGYTLFFAHEDRDGIADEIWIGTVPLGLALCAPCRPDSANGELEDDEEVPVAGVTMHY